MNEKNKKIIIVGVVVALIIIGIVAYMALRPADQPADQPANQPADQPVDPEVPALTGITVSPTIATVVVGETQAFRVTAYPVGAKMGTVTFSVADETIGTINPAGVFTAVAPGTTFVNVAYGKISRGVQVTVTAPVQEIPLE